MSDLLTRLQVLAGSLLAKLSILLGILVVVAQQLPTFGDVPAWLQRDLASVIAILTVVVVQVRNHTQVPVADKGLLPPKGPGTPTVDDALSANPRDDTQPSNPRNDGNQP